MDIEDFFQTEGFVSVLIALLFGAMIGAERQWRQKSAGLRTNTMVSVGAAAYVLLAQHIFDTSGGAQVVLLHKSSAELVLSVLVSS